jgi:hypothetical protein
MQNETQPGVVRNSFGAIDVPDPDGADVAAFAASVKPEGVADDSNATRRDGLRLASRRAIQSKALGAAAGMVAPIRPSRAMRPINENKAAQNCGLSAIVSFCISIAMTARGAA